MGTGKENLETPAKEPVDPELPKQALADLQKLVRGNGIRSDAISLRSFSGEILNFQAFATFGLEAGISEKHVNGKENGEIAGSRSDALYKINAYIDRIGHDREVRQLTAGFLKKRKDVGFAVSNQIISLKRYNKIFVVHEACSPCNASGKIMCQNCRGHRQIPCSKCHGRREIPCRVCAGTQFINTPQGRQTCTKCHGRGRVGCNMCKQTGEIPCPKCKTTGRMPCHGCSGTGWHSHLFVTDVKAKSSFSYDPATLPEDLPPLIDAFGPRLVTEGHADVRIVDELKTDQEMDQLSKPREFIIPYHVKLPYGDIVFAIGKSPITAKLIGYQALLQNMPAILEKAIAPGLEQLAAAAAAKGNVSGLIRKAIRYRAIGETFLAAGRAAPKQTVAIMAARYPYGFAPESLERMATQARDALRHLAQKPRFTGLAAGTVATVLIYFAYFLGPLRNALIKAVALPDLAPDLLLLLAGGCLISAAAQFNAGRAIKNALGPLLKKADKKTDVAPRFGECALYGFPLAAALFAATLFLAIQGGLLPGWLIVTAP